MKTTILAFGIAKEIFGKPKIEVELTGKSVAALKNLLENKFPELKQLSSYLVAVNNEYAGPDVLIDNKDEIAIIPPVSGG